MGLLAGVDPHDLAGHERFNAAFQKGGEFDGEACIADPRHPRADFDFLVEQHRALYSMSDLTT